MTRRVTDGVFMIISTKRKDKGQGGGWFFILLTKVHSTLFVRII